MKHWKLWISATALCMGLSVPAAAAPKNALSTAACPETSIYIDLLTGNFDCEAWLKAYLEQCFGFPAEDEGENGNGGEDIPEDDGTEEEAPEDDGAEEETPEDDGTEEETPEDDGTEEETPEDDGVEEDEEDGQISQMAAAVVDLVNQERAAAGLAPLSVDVTVSRAAQKRAQELVTTFSHTRPNGTSCFTVLQEYGVSYMGAGENIAAGQRSAQEVMHAWMNSEEHRANILNGSFTEIGVGVYTVGGTTYWCQLFTR